jgi:tripartite ATP-independent transporter DctP family solute receptor
MVSFMAVLFAGCGGGKQEPAAPNAPAEPVKLVFKAGHVLAADHPYQKGLLKMDELLNEKTNGQIRLEVFPGSQLGGERELCEGAQTGTVDLGLVTAPLANFDQNWFIFDLPYLFDSKAHAYAFLDGPDGKAMLDGLAGKNIKGVAFFETGFFNVFDNERPLKTPDDVKGLTIRTMENQAYLTYFKAMGANPVPMAYGEIFTALQNNTINGTLIPIASIYTSKFHEVAPYVSRTQNFYCPTTLIMSLASWNKIPDDLKDEFMAAAEGGRDYMRQLLTDSENEQIEKMKAEGAEVIEVDKNVWKNHASVKAVYDELVPAKVPQALVDKAKNAK